MMFFVCMTLQCVIGASRHIDWLNQCRDLALCVPMLIYPTIPTNMLDPSLSPCLANECFIDVPTTDFNKKPARPNESLILSKLAQIQSLVS